MHINAVNTLEIEVGEGRDEVLMQCLHAFIGRAGKWPGCLGYGLTQSTHQTRVWLLSGYWESQAALSAHFADGELGTLVWQVGRQALGIRFNRYLAQTDEHA
ncbi:antibiotic biosynthesis monooxygenase [Pseudomonas shahriarae]|uniref:Antibiotic biosynthesis monooxygenase n=1 Tax=Pseudomonas shahriarae TaxID=2745512 RepID=A0A9X4HFY9_9PSED|nr:antibiotic biosynthesis monooxygenase [Pseudomonas shahriarae]MDD1011314.1 antibiotic biosynthesis monooxygenase [Pseudomonas shahriarae]